MVKVTTTQQTEGDDAFYLSNVLISADAETFQLQLVSGNNSRLYHTSPSHAKRIHQLLGQYLALFEKQYGEIKTVPQNNQETGGDQKKIGFEGKDKN